MDILEIFTVLMMVAALAVFGLRNYKKSIIAYQIETALLICVFMTLHFKYDVHELLVWSIVAIFTKLIFVPFVLFWLIKKLNLISENEPIGGFFVSPVVALSFSLAVSMALYTVFKEFALINEPLPLMAAGFVFMMGIFGFVLRTSFVKQILAYCLFENGVHLSLALLAYDAHEIVEIGIMTDAIFAVVIMSILALRFHQAFGSVDTSKATELKG